MFGGYGKSQGRASDWKSSPYGNGALLEMLSNLLAVKGGVGGGKGKGKGKGKGEGKAVHGDPDVIVNVRNIAYGSAWQDLKDHMKAAGNVEFCEIDTYGDASVRYSSPSEAQTALQLLNGSDFNGRPLKLEGANGNAGLGGFQAHGNVSNFKSQPFRAEVFNGAGGAQVHGDPACLVGVGSLAPGSVWQDLKDHMRTAGSVEFCEIRAGMACVRYSSMAEAHTAIQLLNGTDFKGRAITVEAWEGESGNVSLPATWGAVRPAFKPATIMDNTGNTQVHGDPSSMVWVGNLPPGTRWQDLKDIMRTAGGVKFCNIFSQDDMESGAPAGSACVRYSSQVEAMTAIDATNGMDLNGYAIAVDLWSNLSGGS